MRKEKRERRMYEANGPVAQQFGVHFTLGNPIPFQRMDTGGTAWVRVETATREGTGSDIIRFSGTLCRAHDGESISGKYNVATGKTMLTTWFEL